MQAVQSGLKKSDPSSRLDIGSGQEIGTWHNPPASPWGSSSRGSRPANDIIVDTQDREAWPSISDKSDSDAPATDSDHASGSSKSVTSSSEGVHSTKMQQQQTSQTQQASQSQTPSGGGGGQQAPTPSTSTSATTSSSPANVMASSVWGNSFSSTSDASSEQDSNSGWGAVSSSAGASVGSGGVWGNTPPVRSIAGNNNQATNMQASQSGGRDSNQLTSSAPSTSSAGGSSSSSSSPNLLGWSGNAGAQPSIGAQAGGGGSNSGSREDLTSSMWPGLSGSGGGLPDAPWGSISSSSSVMASSISISQPSTSVSSSLGAKPGEASSTDQWGRGGAASGWGSSHPDPPKPDSESGWGSPEPLVNTGTEGWTQSDGKGTQAWGARPTTAGGWGGQEPPKPAAANPGGWGAQPEKETRAWGESEQKPAASWGASSADSSRSGSSWSMPGEDKPQSQWGAANPPAQSQWGAGNTVGGTHPRPIGSQPAAPSTWAQAAGRGLPSKREPPPAEVRRDPRQEYIAEAISSNESWGKTPINQDSSWDMSESPKTPRKNLVGNMGGGGMGGGGSSSSSSTSSVDDNHWHQPNDGTAIWESAKTGGGGGGGGGGGSAGAGGSVAGGAGGSSTWDGSRGQASGGSGSQWQRESDSGNHWNGPSGGDSSMWNGPPKDTQWSGRRNSEGSRGSWGDGGSTDRGSSGPWNNSREPKSGSWNEKPSGGWGADNHWGPEQGAKSSDWNSGPDNTWQGPGGERPDWENKNNEWNPPPKEDPMWDRNGTNVWGDSSKTETGTWNQGRGSSSRSSSGSWDDTRDIQPSGWGGKAGGGPDIDNGTAYWGDPSSRPPQPKSWNSGMGGQGPVPRPDGGGNWNAPKGSWGDGAPGKIEDWGAPHQPKSASWGTPDNQMMGQWGQGAKPKTPGWGGAPDWGNGSKVSLGTGGGVMKHPTMRSQLLQQLMDMGYKKEEAQNALISNNMNLDMAIADLEMKGRGMEDMGRRGDAPPMAHMPPFSGGGVGQVPQQQQMLAAQLGKPAAGLHAQLNQQRFLHQQMVAAAAAGNKAVPPSAGGPPQMLAGQGQAPPPPPPGGQPQGQASTYSMQQQLIQQQIVEQLHMAVQAGLISPQLLTQQLTPNMLVMLQQLLQLQQVLQKLLQQQMLLTNRAVSPNSNRQQLEQVKVTVQKIRQQILQQQQHINQAQKNMTKQQQPPQQQPPQQQQVPTSSTAPSSAAPAVSSAPSAAPELLKDLPTDMSNMQIKEAPRTSRLVQWKLHSPDREGVDDAQLNKAPGTKPISDPANLQSKSEANTSLPFSDSTWSTGVTEGSTSSWSGANDSCTPGGNSGSEVDAKSITSNDSRESLDLQDDSADTKAGLDIVEFIPGKQWRGTSKTAEDDPFLTPGDFNRSLSVNTVKEDYIASTLGSGKSGGSSPTPPSLGESQWSSLGNLAKSSSSKSSWSSPNDVATSLSSDPWGSNRTRPPPGLTTSKPGSGWPQQRALAGGFHRSTSWAPGDRASVVGGQGGWGSQPAVSSWILLKNLKPPVDQATLKALCMQHGSLQVFQVFAHLGQGVVCYAQREDAIKAQRALSTSTLGNTTLSAEFCSEADVQRLFIQPAVSSSISSAWPSQRTSSLSSMKSEASSPQWNGATSVSSGGMWGSTASSVSTSSSLWAPALDETSQSLLLPGDLLGGQ